MCSQVCSMSHATVVWRSRPCRCNSSSCKGRSATRYFEKISLAACLSGRSTLILRSKRPGRNTAGSMRSCRLLAPITMTFSRDSKPSSSERNWATTVISTSDEIPEPRTRNSESISSKKTITGVVSVAFSRAFLNTSRIFDSVSPTYLFRSSGPLMLSK